MPSLPFTSYMLREGGWEKDNGRCEGLNSGREWTEEEIAQREQIYEGIMDPVGQAWSEVLAEKGTDEQA